MDDPLRDLALRDGRFSPEAFRFLFESLDWAIRLAGKEDAEGPERHITGQELLAGMHAHAESAFGPLAAQVWRSWGLRANLDWGEVVFLLVEGGMLNRQESDTIDDFRDETGFDESFVAHYRPTIDWKGDAPAAPEAGPGGGGDPA